jgi:hypothetical protein
MIKRATGSIKSFTNEEGVEEEIQVVESEDQPEAQSIIVKDVLEIPLVTAIELDINATDEGDDVVAKDC